MESIQKVFNSKFTHGSIVAVNMKKSLTSILILVMVASSIIMAQNASAQTMPKPSVPQFSIQVVDHSYDVPTTYSTDSYTGKQITIPGYHVDDIRVEGKIKNQHFTPYTIPNPNSTNSNLDIEFYYNISYKGHFGTEWRQLDGSEDVDFLKQSYSSEFTDFNISRNDGIDLQDGSQIDVRIKAVIGFETWGFVAAWPYRILNGEDSGWSSTLTITVSKNATSDNMYASTIDSLPYPTLTSPQSLSTPTPTSSVSPTPTVPEFSILAVFALFAIIPVIIVMFVRKKATLKVYN